jgi:hypothetical protein
MPTTAVATLQTIWGCRWSRPGYRIAGIEEQFQPEPTWICIRDGERAAIPERKCETCERWEPEPDRDHL